MVDSTQLTDTGPVQFGKYLLDMEIAKGGMARVYRARLRGPGGFEKKLVVKQILPHLAQDPSFIEMFVQEANTLVQMSHSQIVPVYELGVVDGVYFLAMELVEGATVSEILRDGKLPEGQVVHLGVQICEALRYAHERFNVVHRDVTPRNIIIDAAGHARLLDFGISAPAEHSSRGGLFGSPGYMSPEQARREQVGGQSDLFSLAVVLYEAITGRRAFPESAKRAEAVSEEEVSPLGADDDDVSKPIADLINQMLSKDPKLRPESARDVARSLRTWLAATHPQGVAFELGLRVEAAQKTTERRRSGGTLHTPSTGTSTPHEVRSIATSSELDALVKLTTEPIEPRTGPQGTEPLSRALGRARESTTEELQRDEQPRPMSNPERTGRARLVLVLAAVLSVGAVVTLYTASGIGSQPVASHQPAVPAQPKPAPVPRAEPTPVAQPATEPAPERVPKPSGASKTPVNQGKTEDTAKSAFVTINALPWAEVKLDGRQLGNTPQRRVALKPGKHIFSLHCPPLGRTVPVPVNLSAGKTLNILVDLNADPPKITRR